MRPLSPRRGLLISVAAALVLASAACAPSAEQRETAAQGLMAGIRLLPAATSVSLAATKAFADLGVEEGIHFVKVRIIDRLELRMRFEAAGDIVFAALPGRS